MIYPVVIWWLILASFGFYNFILAPFGVGLMTEMVTYTPKMYWIMIFPIGVIGTILFSMLAYFQAIDY